MAKKAQNEMVIESQESMNLKCDTSDLKEKWEQADKHAQEAFQQAIDKSRRLVAVTQAVKTASSEERKALHVERQSLQLDLEALPYEAGALNREAVIARLEYLKAEDQRLQELDVKLEEEDKQYYDPENGYNYPQTYLDEYDSMEQAKRILQELVNDSGLNSAEWGWQGWKNNEAQWVEYADKRHEEIIQQCMNVREMVLQGKW